MSIKTFIFGIIMFLFLLTFNSKIVSSILTTTADEAFLLLSFFIIFFYMLREIANLRVTKIYFTLLLYFIYQVINYLYSPFDLNLGLVLAQSVINIKVFVVALALVLIRQNNATNRKSIKYLLYLFITLFVFGFVANLVLQESWHLLLAPNEKIEYRYGFIRPIGWLGHPSQNAYFLVTTFATLFLLYSKKSIIAPGNFITKFFSFMVIDFLLAFPLTVRKGMMMSMPFGMAALGMLNRKNKYVFAVITLIFIGFFLFAIKDMRIMEDTLLNFRAMTTDEDNQYIRGLMIFHGFSLFTEFFPFGVGNATFGTVLSQYNTLDVYSYVGLDEWWYAKGELRGVYDSGLFSMLAENGFIGMILMVFFIYNFFIFNKKRLDSYNYIIFKIITWFALLLSLTEPVWQNGMFTVIYTTNLLFIYTKNNFYREKGKWVKYESLIGEGYKNPTHFSCVPIKKSL